MPLCHATVLCPYAMPQFTIFIFSLAILIATLIVQSGIRTGKECRPSNISLMLIADCMEIGIQVMLSQSFIDYEYQLN